LTVAGDFPVIGNGSAPLVNEANVVGVETAALAHALPV
jgi:hypothetical protein